VTPPLGSPPAASDGDPWDRLTALYQQLLDTLQQEREALARGDADALEVSVRHKDALCATIAEAQRALADRSETSSPATDPRRGELQALARRAREQNGINGHMAHRARQTVRALLDVLTGTEQPVYGSPQQDHQPPATGVGHPRYRV